MARKLMVILTLVLAGRMMTLAFIHRAGGDGSGDPPLVWLMPLVGDAVVGVAGLFIAWLILRRTGLIAWTAIVGWNVVGIWDALSAFMISQTAPWPEFFMLQIFGSSMFFLASAMHAFLIWLAFRPEVRAHFLGTDGTDPNPSMI